MICPVCHEEMMVVEYKQIELDVCAICRGVWFDADELDLLLGSLHLPAEGLVRPLTEKSDEKVRKCPFCRRKMEKVLTGVGDREVIDRCKKGHGLWFDGGELDTVIRGLKKPATGVTAEAGAATEASGKAAEEVGSFLADVLLGDARENEEGGQ